ncbi:hypothetical protein [Indioceanicola profundi]|uniref:hypothetical protein n=1 Tax=Indioceanicola profundi TaxID=2220096 RepID=UPI000E6ADF81|nr:hypothetical protein [Indioceanicola profundi]
MDAVTRARISKRERQRRWRQRNIEDRSGRRGTSVVAHLNDIEIALLDKLAIDDYKRRPCGRDDGADLSPPSRSRAIRLLIRRVLDLGLVDPAELGPLIPLKDEMGSFWSLETCWRRASRDRRSGVDDNGELMEQPEPPWRPKA